MCGFLAWASTRLPVERDRFERATDSLAHRGPDARGTWYGRDDRAALGHRRLSILDLSDAGAQPMHLRERDLHLVYNGEIYNHPELKRELEAKGHVYRSSSDTETVLRAYAEWGEACVERLVGIFGFAIWDGGRRRLFAARDHLGVKPVYLFRKGSSLAVASQPRAFFGLPRFTPRIAPEAALDVLGYGVVPGERAIFRDTAKLLPGHALTWQDGETAIRRYWTPPDAPEIDTEAAAIQALDAAIPRSIAAQLQSDVPVTTFLSGGIDSSLVTAIAAERSVEDLRAFTMGFETPKADERAFAAKTAAHCGARPVVGVLGHDAVDALVDAAVEAYDEPFGIAAALPMLAISRLAAEHGTKVVLTGDGADELFAGYRHYDTLAAHYRRAGRATAERIESPARAAWSRLRHGPFDPLDAYKSHNAEIRGACQTRLAGPALVGAPGARWREARHFAPDRVPQDAGRRADLMTYLPDEILVKVDRATMAYGIEARVPFLDPRLVELAFRIAPALHVAGGERKALLKRVARRWLPDEILTARKKGFSIPLTPWLRRPGTRERVMETLRHGRLVRDGWLDPGAIEPVTSRLSRPSFGLFQLYLMERWVGRWLP